MPFTLFHPALVLPARYLPAKWKRYVSITGLITGSVAPDFEKFIRMKSGNSYSHTLAGAFGFDLPMSVLLAVLFHWVVKDTLINYLPVAGLSARFSGYRTQNWLRHLQRRYVVVIASMLVGIFSHLVLDSATHANGKLARVLPLLSNYYEVLLLNARGYQLLEIFYYVLSALVLCWAFVSLPRQRISQPAKRSTTLFWTSFAGLTALVIGLRLLVNPDVRHIWDLASLATSAGLIGMLLCCLGWRRQSQPM